MAGELEGNHIRGEVVDQDNDVVDDSDDEDDNDDNDDDFDDDKNDRDNDNDNDNDNADANDIMRGKIKRKLLPRRTC